MEKKVKKVVLPFSKLTKAEKRVAIAKDVLAQVKIQTIFPVQGNYIEIDEIKGNFDSDVQVNSLIKDKKISCNCCMKGSLFMAHVNKTNHLTLDDLDSHGHSNNESMYERLDKIFTQEQLDLMECAFEGDLISDSTGKLSSKEDLINKAYDNFFIQYNDETERLIAICKNLIKNKGTFIP